MLTRYAPALVVLLLLLSTAVILTVTRGADARILVTRLDVTGEDRFLNVYGEVTPPLHHNYPAFVARVNGELLTGDDLLAQQFRLLENRRTLEFGVSPSDTEYGSLFTQFAQADPLVLLIEEALL